MSRVEYEVLTSTGTVLLRTPDLDIAKAFKRDRAKKAPGLALDIDEVVTTRRRIGWTRPQLKLVRA